jgi:hypothetical protein
MPSTIPARELSGEVTPEEEFKFDLFRAQKFRLKLGDALHIYSNAQAMTLKLRREVPSEIDVAATSFNVSVVLTSADAIALAGELLTAAAAQMKPMA